MKAHTCSLELKKPFNLPMTVESHGWCQLAPWYWDGKHLERNVRIGSQKEWIRVQQIAPHQLRIETSSPNTAKVTERVSHWLHLDWDPSEFLALCEANDPAIGHFIRSGGGRFLRGDTFFEDLIKTVCTINTTWQQTKVMVASLVSLGDGLFPEPSDILDIGPERLARECKLGFRAKTVTNVTAQLLDDDVIAQSGSAGEGLLTYDYLVSLKGIGPYSAAHAMMLLRDFSTLPVDSEVSAYLRERGFDPKDAQESFRHWGQYRFLGYKLKRIVDKENWIGE
jgi:N-glycosylase/DNA lyase